MASLSINGICRLTRDPDLIKSQRAAWLHFGLAAYRRNPREGTQEVDFFEGEYYVRNPESGIDKRLKKGALVYLDRAELRNDRFMGQDGRERYKTKILIYNFDIMDRELNFSAAEDLSVPKPTSPIKEKNNPNDKVGQKEINQMYNKPTVELEDGDDDIPF